MEQRPHGPSRLQITPPTFQHQHGGGGAAFVTSPASYQTPYFAGGGGAAEGGGMTSPLNPPSFFPPPLQGQYGAGAGGGAGGGGGGGIGLGFGAPPMSFQYSGGSDAPLMMRSTSTSSNGSGASGLPSAPGNFAGPFQPYHPYTPPQNPQFSPQQSLLSRSLHPSGPFSPLPPPPFVQRQSPNPPPFHHPRPQQNLHALTSSFHYGHSPQSYQPPGPRPHRAGRTSSISIRPGQSSQGGLESPTCGRAGSVSPGLSPTFPRREEVRKRKLVVRVPREREEDDPVDERGKSGRKQSTIRRRPLFKTQRAETLQRMEHETANLVALEEDELVGRPVHWEEVKLEGLPETLEVFLPGKEAWEDVWGQYAEETTEKFGYCDARKPSFLVPPRSSFLTFDTSFPPSPASSTSGFSTPRSSNGHGRAASLFNSTGSSLPPRLQNVLDRARGHGSSLSLSFAGGLAAFRGGGGALPVFPGGVSPGSESGGRSRLTPTAKSFTMPAPPPPMALLPPPSAPANAVLEPVAASPKDKWKPSLQELGRGFGIEEEKEDEAFGGVEMDEEVVAQVKKGAEQAMEVVEEETQVGERIKEVEEEEAEEAEEDVGPSRRTSMTTDRTDVASQSEEDLVKGSDAVEELVSDIEPSVEKVVNEEEDSTRSSNDTNPSLGHELSRALSDLGSISVPPPHPLTSSPSLPVLPSLPAIEIHVDGADGGYDASDDSDWNDDGDVEKDDADRESDYSNLSDEENAGRRALSRDRSSEFLRRDAISPAQHNKQVSDGLDGLDLPAVKYASERSFGTGEASSLTVNPDVLFQAPSDVDATDIERGDHGGAKRSFEFPSRLPGNSPVKIRPAQPEKVALPSSPESLSNAIQPDLPAFPQRSSSLNVGAPEFTFGGGLFGRLAGNGGSAYSSGAENDLDFGSFGRPGSLRASPSIPGSTPPGSAPLNPSAGDFRPSSSSATRSTFALLQRQGSAASLGSSNVGWGTAGQPGSIASSSPGFTPPQLNAFANEFSPPTVGAEAAAPQRSFDFQPPENAPTLVMLVVPSIKESPRRTSGSHGPLPPIPLTHFTPLLLDHKKRLKVENGVDGQSSFFASPTRVVSAPKLAHPQPRRPLPLPPLQIDIPGAAHRRLGAVDADQEEAHLRRTGGTSGSPDAANGSLLSLDDPLPEQYAPSHPVVNKSNARRGGFSAGPGPRPFSLRAQPSFTSDGRILSFQPAPASIAALSPLNSRRRSPLPSFQPPSSPDADARDAEREEASPARMGDPRVRHESVDILVPSLSRPRERAVMIPPEREGTGSDIFDDSEAVPLTPFTDGDGASVVQYSGDDDGSEEDDLPLRILENILADQFDSLKIDLAALRSKPDYDDLVESFATRVELLLATSHLRSSTTEDLPTLIADAHERTERVVLAALQRFQPSSSSLFLSPPSRPTPIRSQTSVSAPTTPMRSVTPGLEASPAAAYGSFLDDLRATVLPLTQSQIDVESIKKGLEDKIQAPFDEIKMRLDAWGTPGEGKDMAAKLLDGVRNDLTTIRETQKTLLDASTVSKNLQATLKSSMGQLGLDVTSRLDNAYSQLEELVKANLASTSGAKGEETKMLRLELVKSRNDHGKARSEKAVLADRLEARTVEIIELRQQLAQQAETLKQSSRESAEAADRAAQVAQELALLKLCADTVETQRDSARKKVEDVEQARQKKVEESQATAEELVRLRSEVEQLKASNGTAQREQRSLQTTLHAATAAKEQAVRERGQAREELAAASGTVAALEKRLATQDERLATAQQALARNHQTASTDLAAANIKINDLESALLDSDAIVKDNDKLRGQLKAIEAGLKKRKSTVSRELAEASSKINTLTDERDRLAEENAHYVEEKEQYLLRQNGSSTYYTPPFPSSLPNTPPNAVFSSPSAPTALKPQHTGDSVDSISSDDTVAHTSFSPAASVSGASFVQDDDGWFSAA